ncbi:nitroreductase/quinone reductase family protein [Embleya sp. AB8]|uniref:nitroreductase/quinone reductase family protein n=1 Tax=Embleya sp. AB8 TaxID=3156304 RepID=UPI003C71EFE7
MNTDLPTPPTNAGASANASTSTSETTAAPTAPAAPASPTSPTPPTTPAPTTPTRYIAPKARIDRAMNRAVAFLARHGVSVWGSRILYVRGRKSGELRSTPVNPLPLNGERFLVAPRGTTQWVRNMRVAGGGELRIGRRREEFTVVEVPDAEKPEILRAYLAKWKFEVGVFFDGVDHRAPDAELARIAPGYPVFRVIPRTG